MDLKLTLKGQLSDKLFDRSIVKLNRHTMVDPTSILQEQIAKNKAAQEEQKAVTV